MSQLDALLARSRAPGAFKNRRHFTLSREKAIEKQREFALRDPRGYVLEIIQGAVFAGATYMAVDARKNDILIAWVGAPMLQREELENLFDYLFANRTDARIRHMVQLAVGINALIQRKPRSIRLESGAGGRCIRLEMDADGQNASIGEVENPIEGTYLIAEFGGGWMQRFGFTSSQETNVEALIEKRCLYTPVPILLNGNAPFGFRATRNIEIFGSRDQVQFDEGERRGVVALHSSAKAPRGFRVVVGGVWITDLPLTEVSDKPLVGVICDDGLRKTADQADIVQDDRYVRLLHAVQPHATTLVRRTVDAGYVPPTLPAVATVEAEEVGSAGPEVVYAPVPDVIPMVGPRGTTEVARLEGSGDEPVFWCVPEKSRELEGEVADPLRFPFRLLVLDEGQANQLGRDLPELALHRLNAASDIDFVLRVMERGIDVRRVTVPLRGGVLQVRLHRAGRLPAWGNGREGTPVLLRKNGRSVATGVIDQTRVFFHHLPPYELSIQLGLPRLSLVLESEGDLAFDDEIARQALAAAWQVAAPESGEPDPELLAALLGHEAQPQFAEHPHPVGQQHHPDAQVVLGAALPPSWPVRLRRIPLIDVHTGPLDLDGYLALVQQGEVAWVRDEQDLARMEPLEARFGYGHLALHGVDELPLFAVALVGSRWQWVRDDGFFDSGKPFTHLVFVAPHLAVRTHDRNYELVEQPAPELLAVRRREAPPADLEEAWRLLYEGLKRLELENLWSRRTKGARLARSRSLGRLALFHLAERVEGASTHPILLPSDGGARWSLERLRASPSARVSAANGVVVAEPTTFCLTYAAYLAVAPKREVRLRYDDHPDVWRSLAETSGEGWLLRTEIQEPRLKGWLGLRMPYDATCGILFRTTGNLMALPELDERIPAHGLLWPTHGHHLLTEGERQLLQLAGLRMYAQLVDLLKGRLDPERAAAARLYAWVFCFRAHQRGRLSGTAMQLARQVEVFGEDGRTWGTLDRWLDTPASRRPAPPEEVVLPEPPEEEAAPVAVVKGPQLAALQRRLAEIVPRGMDVEVQAGELGRGAIVETSSTGRRVSLRLNLQVGLVADGIASEGAARELLLLEMARKLAQWSRAQGEDLQLLRLQQMLLSQRFED